MGICSKLVLNFNGKTLDRVSHEKTVHRTIFSPFLIFFKLKVFRHLRMTRMGFDPPPHNLLKKVDENFSVYLGKISLNFLFFPSENIGDKEQYR